MPSDYISLIESVSLFPTRPHVNTIRRWAARGCNGVVLRTVKWGKRRMTRPEWISEFVYATICATDDIYRDSQPAPATSTSHQRAESKLDAMGV